jgi:hypothetical protein
MQFMLDVVALGCLGTFAGFFVVFDDGVKEDDVRFE